MGYWVVAEYWLIIQYFNEQIGILNIYTFTFKKLKWILFNPEVTVNKCKVKTVKLKMLTSKWDTVIMDQAWEMQKLLYTVMHGWERKW